MKARNDFPAQKSEPVSDPVTPITSTSGSKPETKPVSAPASITLNLIEKDDSFSEEGSEEEDINAQFIRLHKLLDTAKQRKTNVWGLTELINGFTTAYGYELDNDETEILFDDMKTAADMLDAAEAYIKAKDSKAPTFPAAFEPRLNLQLDKVLNCAKTEITNNREHVRGIFIKIGIALSIVALGAAVGILAAGAAPFIAAGCLLAGIVFLAASAIALYRQSNCTFFGQAQKNHMLMVDLAAATESSVLEPKTAGCFG